MTRFETSSLPGLSNLLQLTETLAGRPIHVLDISDHRGRSLGNHGDWIMHQVFDQILHQLDTTRVQPRDAEAIVIPPNGALLDIYQAPRLIAESLSRLPDIPVVIFPSSSRFVKANPAEIFGRRKAPTIWISRERYSHDHLRSDWGRELADRGVTLAVDHDVVCSGHDFVPPLFPDLPQVADLVVARLGVEAGQLGNAPARASWARRSMVKGFNAIPSEDAQRLLRRYVTRNQQREANQDILAKSAPFSTTANEGHEGINIDISDPTLASRGTYLSEVAQAKRVITNRLHVALPALILGAEVVLVDSGYHKLRGVYERTLSAIPNIAFIPSTLP